MIMINSMKLPKNGCSYCFFRKGNKCSQLSDVSTDEIIEYAKEELRHPKCPLCEPGLSTGTWKRYIDHDACENVLRVYKCSNCEEEMFYKTNFCPSCGAMMKGENE